MNAAGAQSRFVLYLLLVLVCYTLLLLVFQKLTGFLPLYIFFPIALIILLVFIGIVGVLYSHTFVGPMVRIRRSIQHMAQGDMSVSLRLRESDDPMLKDLVTEVTQLCEHSRNSQALVKETAQDLFTDLTALQDRIQKGADRADIQKQLDSVRRKQDLLETAIRSFKKT
jgi:nitrogen fixation/metabolism regulation signal transduction histidine kinase